jgi:hypothetical protein
MPSNARAVLGVAAASAALATTLMLPTAAAQPDEFATDDRGFVGTSARCVEPATAVAFGRTQRSLVAICVEDGEYEYRGVRLRDGAKLVIPAERSDGVGFAAENEGVGYLVTATALVVSVGERVIRDEPMVEFSEPGAPEASPTPTTSLPPPLPAEVGGSGS